MKLKHFINGNFVDGLSTKEATIKNPATNDVLYHVPLGNKADVDKAVASAKNAFKSWRLTPAVDRARFLFRYKSLLEKRMEELAVIVSKEHGKTVAEAMGSVKRGMENVEHACGIPTLLMGESLEDVARGIDTSTFKEPMGVFAGITPYNFPAMVPLWFWPYALMTGNTFILKPSEKVPGSSNFQMELIKEVGFPEGIINMVHGDSEVANALLEHPDIAGVSFVGSSNVAKKVYEKAASHHKRVQALGGAKNHAVVMSDCEAEQSIQNLAESAFGCSGQRCLASSIAVFVGDAYDQLVPKLVEYTKSMKVGNGLDACTQVGPLISEDHKARVLQFIDNGVKEGAELLVDGRSHAQSQNNFLAPSIFAKVKPEMSIMKEEIFGPVLCVTQAKNLNEAIEIIRNCPFANAVSLFTSCGKSAQHFKREIGVSMIGINIGVAAPMAFFPFGGTKNSFFGDTKAHGKDAIKFYTDQKMVISRWF